MRQREAEGERGDKSNRPFAVEPLGASGQQTDTPNGYSVDLKDKEITASLQTTN